nr:reverse transcriptase domain-containing protein [Tanacetum cinerariifolium]
NGRNGCSYKDFVACKPKEFDGKGGMVAYVRWVKRIEAIQDIIGCGDNQKVKYFNVGMTWEDFKALMTEEYCPSNEMQKLETKFWNHAMIRRMVAATKPPAIQSAILKAGVAVRNGSLKRSGESRGDGEESSKEGNVKGDNKRARTGKLFAIITNHVRKEYTGSAPRCSNRNFHHNLKTPCCMCTNCNRLWHFAKDYRVGPKMVNPQNARNQTIAHEDCYECSGTKHYKSRCPRLNRVSGQGGNRQNQAMAIQRG